MLLLCLLGAPAIAKDAGPQMGGPEKLEREFHEVGKTEVMRIFDKERTLGMKLGQCLEQLKAAEKSGAPQQFARNGVSRLLAPQVNASLSLLAPFLTWTLPWIGP